MVIPMQLAGFLPCFRVHAKSVSKKRKRKRKEKKSKEKSVYSAFEKESSARKNPMYYRTIVSNLTCGHIICMLY